MQEPTFCEKHTHYTVKMTQPGPIFFYLELWGIGEKYQTLHSDHAAPSMGRYGMAKPKAKTT